MPESIYENPLKSAYSVESGGKRLVITGASFYRLSAEAAWILGELPACGPEKAYLSHLSTLGLNEPRQVFDRLIEIGALRIQPVSGYAKVFRRLLNPKFQLLTPQIQERALAILGIDLNAVFGRWLPFLVALSAAGIFWSAFQALNGSGTAIPGAPAWYSNWPLVLMLALGGCLTHELGHSWAAAAGGIGLRPIGLSIYLVFPVFYANISGIETLSFRQKALIDCGGFLFQGIYVLLLLTGASLSGNGLFAAAGYWMIVLMIFNLNPFFRTDAYWLYKDFLALFKGSRLACGVHVLYCAAFIVFSGYFLWRLWMKLADMSAGLAGPDVSQDNLFLHWGSVAALIYVLALGFAGSLRRFREMRRELLDAINLRTDNLRPI